MNDCIFGLISNLIGRGWVRLAEFLLGILGGNDLRFVRLRAALQAKKWALGYISLRHLRASVDPLIDALLLHSSPARDSQLCGLLSVCGTGARRRLLAGVDTDDPTIRVIVGEELLRDGDYERGFANYLSRIDCPLVRGVQVAQWKLKLARHYRWQGESLIGKTALLIFEGGHGDMIMLARFFFLLAPAARSIGLVQAGLVALFRRNFPHVEWVSDRKALPTPSNGTCVVLPFDLPAIAKVSIASLTRGQAYLYACPERIGQLRKHVGARRGMRVALCWRGYSGHLLDRLRSMALRMLAPLLAVPGVQFFGLTPGADKEMVRTAGITDLSPLLNSFDETAAILECMDLTISVDTAVAHLAGALDRPVWVLLPSCPDWRWSGHGGSHWYRTARIFQQDDESMWQPVVMKVSSALRDTAKFFA